MSSRSTLGTIKRIVAILIAIAIVLAAGILVGQAPALFGVEESPSASITFEDQERDGTAATIEEVSLSDGGFVVITDGGTEPLAVSEYLEAGTHENVTVEAGEDADRELVGQLTATVHQDTDDDEEYTYQETDGEEDRPYLEDGFPVSATATVTTAENEGLTDSFVVESVDAPSNASTNETITVVAEIRNPTDFTTQQSVEFRVDGTVIEQQILELEAEETREVTFEVDTQGSEPGEQIIGVYTDADGMLETIELEDLGPAVAVTDASEDNVTVDATLPTDGFVAVERADGNETGTENETDTDDETVFLGTSDALDRGDHENVTIDLEESVDENETLAAALYEGDPEAVDGGNATPIEDDGPVETRFTIADAGADGGGGDANGSETDIRTADEPAADGGDDGGGNESEDDG